MGPIRKIIREVIAEICNKSSGSNVYKVKEGIGDKYLVNKYPNFRDDESEFEKNTKQ